MNSPRQQSKALRKSQKSYQQLSEWNKADSDAAAQWVKTEGGNLPPETRQYVAMAYAREAASQGDIELADEWAALILDEKRRARVIKGTDAKR